jgi:hypothetical protein
MMKSRPFIAAVAALRRGYRQWRAEQLLPSVLYDLNRHFAEDVGIVPQHVIDALERRRR